MHKALQELLTDDDIFDENGLSREIFIDKICVSKDKNLWNIYLDSYSDLNSQQINIIKNKLSYKLNIPGQINIIINNLSISKKEINIRDEKEFRRIINETFADNPVISSILICGSYKIENNIIDFFIDNKFSISLLKNRKSDASLEYILKNKYGIEYKVIFNEMENSFEEYKKVKEAEDNQILVEYLKNSDTQKIQKFKNEFKADNKEKNNRPLIYGRRFDAKKEDIISINEDSGKVIVSGEIFKTDIKETKSGKIIFIIYITDYTSSITVKLFLKPEYLEEIKDKIKTGNFYRIQGEVVDDKFSRELVIIASAIEEIEFKRRMDTAAEKRVELHLHTQMSAMDGVSSAASLVGRAAEWGHSAVAITDHGVAQAFPEAMQCAAKNGIKIIYGVEAYLVDDGEAIVHRAEDIGLDSTFVVFDIETTGLNSVKNEIIEIGAVKLRDCKIIDRYSAFVNPKIEIPEEIVELTGITQEMVMKADAIEDILPEFFKFINGAPVAAHNAKFDTGFIKEKAGKLGLEFPNTILDTLPLSRWLLPNLKKHKLNIIAEHLGIRLESHHRAVDDAEAAAHIFLKFIKMLKEKGASKLTDINKLYSGNFDVKKADTYHAVILVKNYEGLYNLYKLISISHIEYFYKKPRIPKSLFQQYRDGLIIGSGCEAGQVFRAVLNNYSDSEVENIVKFYDYLEIQPRANNAFLIGNDTVKDEDALLDINRKITALGEKYNKPVAATGDVHFLDSKDEYFRRILMSAQGFPDADNQAPLYYKTTDEMLDEFSYLGKDKAYEVVVKNPNFIASMIEAIKPVPDGTFPPKIDGAEDEVKNMALKRAHEIYGEKLPEIVQKRLDRELSSIINHGYAVLYLIAHKLVAKSLSDGYLVGSRGSVGSSLAAAMCGITEVNPLVPHYICPKCKKSEFFSDGSIGSGADLPDKFCPICGTPYKKDGHDILFEVFLGFEGDKEPDIDLNFSGEYQPAAHKYTEELFGSSHVFRAGTIGTIAEKTAFGFVKGYVDSRHIKTNQAEIERLVMGCTGIKRTTGQHPGGVMVVPRDKEIYEFTPIQKPADDNDTDVITTHFDYHSISGRLLKLDILGHDDPTVIRMLQDLTGIDPIKIPLGDKNVLKLFTSTQSLGVNPGDIDCEVGTLGLPEFGTKFVRQMLIETQPKTFAELLRISGLSHGTNVWTNNAQDLIKNGCATLKDVISTRDDIMIYLIQKGVNPKNAFNIMEKVRKGKGLNDEDIKEMRENGISQWYIESCNKIVYLFPKGHAVAYVMMAIRIAYFKVYYPKAYYCTYFTVRADDFDGDLIVKGEKVIKQKIKEIEGLGNNTSPKEKGLMTILEIAYEMYKRGIRFVPVDLYKSDALKFISTEEGILLPFKALQGVGENAAKNITKARGNGLFLSKEDLRLRCKLSKTAVDILENHGCLNGLPDTNQLSLF